jgi:GNAT superfamily N-acetyltransferase
MAKTLICRPYQLSDIEYMVKRAEEVIPQMLHYRNITFSKVRTEFVLKQNLNPQSGFAAWVMVDNENVPRGFGAGYCVPNMLSLDMVANDVILYVDPEHRSIKNADTLIAAYIKWARDKGAKLIKASETSGMVGNTVDQATYDKFLSRHGFERVGSVYFIK